jgi:hypothetical protein
VTEPEAILRERQEIWLNFSAIADTPGWQEFQDYLLSEIQNATQSLMYGSNEPGDLREAVGRMKALTALGSYGQRLQSMAQPEPEELP